MLSWFAFLLSSDTSKKFFALSLFWNHSDLDKLMFLWSLCSEARLKALLISCLCLVPASLSLSSPLLSKLPPLSSPESIVSLTLVDRRVFVSCSNEGAWSNAGCELDEKASNSTDTVCRCHHLTNFAVLMSPYRSVSQLTQDILLDILRCDSWCDRIYWQKLAWQEMLMWEDKLLFVPRAEFPWRHRPQHHHLHRLRALCPRLSRHTHRLPKTLEVRDWLGC